MAELSIHTDNGDHVESFHITAFPRDLIEKGLFTSRLTYAIVQALVKERNEQRMPT